MAVWNRLGGQTDKVEAAYRRGDAIEKRRAMMEAWADFCETSKATSIVSSLCAMRTVVASSAGRRFVKSVFNDTVAAVAHSGPM